MSEVIPYQDIKDKKILNSVSKKTGHLSQNE